MINIDDPSKVDNTPALWRLGFRPFFLGGALLASLYIPLWLLTWFYPQYSSFSDSFWAQVVPLWWHPHEMLFGFAIAIVAGFLLTAVQNWTNQPGMKGNELILTFGCWLGARLLLLVPAMPSLWLAAGLDTAFLLLVAFKLWRSVYKVKQWRNSGFPIMLLVALVVNLVSYYALSQRDFTLSHQLWQGMLWWFALLITIIGGRVIPFFTAMRLQTTKPTPKPLIENSLLVFMILLVINGITGVLSDELEMGLLLAAAVLHLIRYSSWQGTKTLKEPMLWSLHIAYLCLPITLALLAINVDDANAYRHLLHLFAIATLAGMCLAMISRVSLGHTSRNIYQGPNMVLAFICLPLAAICRAIMPLAFPEWSQFWLWTAAGLWSLAFGLFVWHYAPILTRPRVDGRPG